MRILIVPTADLSYNSGSVIYAKNEYKYLREKGAEVYLLSSGMPNDIPLRLRENIIIKDHLLFHPVIDDRLVTNLQYAEMAKEIIETIISIYEIAGSIDIIHAHYLSINSFASIQICEILNIPVIVSAFGRDISIGFYSDERIKKFIEYSCEKASRIIVPDKTISNLIRNTVVNKEVKYLDIIPMPLDKRIFCEGDLKLPEAKIISTINSCFTKEKGIDDIIKAYSLIYTNETHLIIAGNDDDKDDANYKRLEKLIIDMNLESSVTFVGYLSRENVGELLRKSDIFVDARLNSNFSSVLIEAQFSKTFTIAADNDAARQIFSFNNGVLFKAGDWVELALIIKRYLLDEDLIDEIRKNIQKWIMMDGEQYLEDTCFLKLYELMQETSLPEGNDEKGFSDRRE